MTALTAIGRRYLPLGWKDLLRQLVIWFGFLFAYQIARGLAEALKAGVLTQTRSM